MIVEVHGELDLSEDDADLEFVDASQGVEEVKKQITRSACSCTHLSLLLQTVGTQRHR